jgi:hypothetical protein
MYIALISNCFCSYTFHREPVAAINGFRTRHHRARRADVRRHVVNLTAAAAQLIRSRAVASSMWLRSGPNVSRRLQQQLTPVRRLGQQDPAGPAVNP